MTQPEQSNEDVTNGGTGFNPYRTSQLAYSDLWKNGGHEARTRRRSISARSTTA